MDSYPEPTINEQNLFGLYREMGRTRYVRYACERGVEWAYSDRVVWPKGVFLAQRPGTEPAALVAEVTEHMLAGRMPRVWITSPASRAELLDPVLLREGFVAHPALPAMLLEPAAYRAPDVFCPELSIREVSERPDLEQWACVARNDDAGAQPTLDFGDMWSQACCARPADFRFFVGALAGEDAGVVALYTAENVAGLYWVATRPAFRGRGVGTAVTRRAVEEAFAAGARRCVLHATEMGVRIYRRLGFRELFSYGVFRLP